MVLPRARAALVVALVFLALVLVRAKLPPKVWVFVPWTPSLAKMVTQERFCWGRHFSAQVAPFHAAVFHFIAFCRLYNLTRTLWAFHHERLVMVMQQHLGNLVCAIFRG